MTSVDAICPYCLYIERRVVKEKDTVVCDKCRRPFELYEDGRVEKSALRHVDGHYKDRKRVSYSYGMPSWKKDPDN